MSRVQPHIPDDQYLNEWTAVLAPASKRTLELQSGRNSGYAYGTYRASRREIAKYVEAQHGNGALYRLTAVFDSAVFVVQSVQS